MKHLILAKIDVSFHDLHDQGSYWAQHEHEIKLHEELGKAVERLAENVWLLERDKGWQFLVDLLAWGHRTTNHYPITVRFFDSDSED